MKEGGLLGHTTRDDLLSGETLASIKKLVVLYSSLIRMYTAHELIDHLVYVPSGVKGGRKTSALIKAA